MPRVGEQPGVYTIMANSGVGYEPEDRQDPSGPPAELGLSAFDVRDEAAGFSVANVDVLGIGTVKNSCDRGFD